MASSSWTDPRYAWVDQIRNADLPNINQLSDNEEKVEAIGGLFNNVEQNEPIPEVTKSLPVLYGALRKDIEHSGWLDNRAFKRQQHIDNVEDPSGDEPSESSSDSSSRSSSDSVSSSSKQRNLSVPPANASPAAITNPQPPAPFTDRDTHRFQQAWDLIQDGIAQAKRDPTQKQYYIEGDIPELTKNLFPMQREGVGRLEHLEQQYNGGILGDEMGLGKTIQVIALLARAKSKRGVGGCTLVIMSPALLKQWADELQASPSLLVYTYDSHPATPVKFDDYDVVLTTWTRIAQEWSRLNVTFDDWKDLRDGHRTKRRKGKQVPIDTNRVSAPFFAYRWKRVVLDEAHRIRNTNTDTFKSVSALRAKFRLCISGTPLQNDYGDFYALMSFLQIAPFDNQSFFNRCFVHKGKKGSNPAAGKLRKRMEVCMASVRRAVCVRRVKESIFLGLRVTGAPERTVIRSNMFSLEPDAQAIQDECKHFWDPVEHFSRQKAKKNGTHVGRGPDRNTFEQIIRMRLACCHPKLIDARYGADDDEGDDDDPVIVGERVSGKKAKAQARKGDTEGAATNKNTTEENAEKTNPRSEFIKEMSKGDAWRSNKIDRTLLEIGKALEAQKTYADSLTTTRERREAMSRGKVIVFSSFLSASDLVAIGLKSKNIPFYEINGQVSENNRRSVLRKFEELDTDGEPKNFNDDEPDEVRVLLASLLIAAEGLNVVHASRIIFISPVWNPFMELQAIGRADRVGQTQPVEVTYIESRNSVEQRIKMVCLQKKSKVRGITGDDDIPRDLKVLNKMTIDSFTSLVKQRKDSDRAMGDGGSEDDSDEDSDLGSDMDPDEEYVPYGEGGEDDE